MPKDKQPPKPPTGLTKFMFRFPILLYRIGLGWLMGGRFILVRHIGRKSHQERQAVLEVIRADRDASEYTVISAYGEKAQWFQNLMAQPDVDVQVGAHKFAAHAGRLSPGDGSRVLATYATEHPAAARMITRLMGYEGEGTVDDFRELGTKLPIVVFKPRG